MTNLYYTKHLKNIVWGLSTQGINLIGLASFNPQVYESDVNPKVDIE